MKKKNDVFIHKGIYSYKPKALGGISNYLMVMYQGKLNMTDIADIIKFVNNNYIKKDK